MTTDELAREFCDCTLPGDDWTHFAHLRVGLWHLLRYPPHEALDLLRERIRRYNESLGGINSDTAGYHETITAFYVWAIDRFLAAVDRTQPIDDLAAQLIRDHGDKELPRRYWSKDRLMSTPARLAWVEPDLQPLNNL
jgi:hypothetical protein